MSNYINYSIKLNNCTNKEVKSFMKDLSILSNNIFQEYDSNIYNTFDVWNNYIKDLCFMSKKYPNIFITVDCSSDDDIWRVYITNGKYQIAEGSIVYENFDINKLEEYKDE